MATNDEGVSRLVMSDSLRGHGLFTPSGSSVHGVLQARILEWVAIPFSRASSQPRDQSGVSYITGRFLTIQATVEMMSRAWINCE